MFGEMNAYRLSTYNEILPCEQIHLFSLTKNKVISILKEHLRKGLYIIASLRYNPEKCSVHEILLFGFDDKKQIFMCLELKGDFLKKQIFIILQLKMI